MNGLAIGVAVIGFLIIGIVAVGLFMYGNDRDQRRRP